MTTLGFAANLTASISCTKDGSPLEVLPGGTLTAEGAIWQGHVGCRACPTCYHIEDGILNMLVGVVLDEESRHEQTIREREEQASHDSEANAPENDDSLMDMVPTLRALGADGTTDLLELGCGDGRYTVQ